MLKFSHKLIIFMVAMVLIGFVLIIVLLGLCGTQWKSSSPKSLPRNYQAQNPTLDNKHTIHTLEKQIQQGEKNASHYQNLAELYSLEGNYKKSIEHYKNAIALNHTNVYLYLDASEIYEQIKDYKNGLILLKEGLQFHKKNGDMYNNICWFEAQLENYTLAMPYCKKALELSPHQDYILDTAGYVQVGLKNYEEAINLLDEAVSISPSIPELRLHIAYAYERKGDFQGALEHYKTYLELVDQHDRSYKTKSKVLETVKYLEDQLKAK